MVTEQSLPIDGGFQERVSPGRQDQPLRAARPESPSVMGMLAKDLRFGLRALYRNPGFAVTVVATLALGIGVNTAIFSIVHSVMLQSLPYPDAERLVWVWPDGAMQRAPFGIFQEGGEVYEELMGFGFGSQLTLTGDDGPQRLDGVYVTPGFFSTLGVGARIGRSFEAGEDRPGRERVAVLSHRLFEQRFRADADIVGGTIVLDGTEHTVVGIMPPDFGFPTRHNDIWLPAVLDPRDFSLYWGGPGSIQVIGRLRDGVSIEQAHNELQRLIPRLRESYPWPQPEDFGKTATVASLQDEVVGDVKPILLLLLSAVGLVLLIACVNVANLLLVRARSRQKELAVRSALGAGPGQLVRQLLGESLLLGALGGGAGLLLGYGLVALLRSRLPADVPRLDEIGLDVTVLGFTLLLALATGLLFGLLPALRASRPDLQRALQETNRTAGGGREHRRLASALVAAELALALVLAIGAGLLIRSFWLQVRSDPGFRPDNLLTAEIAPPAFRFPSEADRRSLYERFSERLAALPMAESVGWTSQLPFTGEIFGGVFLIEGREMPRGNDWPQADVDASISTDYLQTLGVSLIRGRWLTDADREGAEQVVLISESLARRYWEGEDAVGARIQIPGQEVWKTIVGVVADIKSTSLTDQGQAALYQPLAQGAAGPMSLVVRTRSDPLAFAADLRDVISSVDGETPISSVRTMDSLISESLTRPRFTMAVLMIFAGLALVLALVGIYSVTANTVRQRHREIAMRMALGATPGSVMRQILKQGSALALIGLAIGIPAAIALTRLLSSLLYGISATDPLTFAAVSLLLATVAVLASLVPARRAMTVDPMTVLRVE